MPPERPVSGYRNIFTAARRGKQPLILQDGTSVEFPDTWTEEQAQTWRKYTSLTPIAWKDH